MKNQISQLVTLLVLLAAPGILLAANRYWVHKPFYENTFSTPADLADWNLIEDNGTGSWQLTGDGTAILTMDDGDYANRLFNVNGAAPRFLPLDIANGRVEILVGATTGGDQQIFVQAELFTASNAYITQIDLLAPQNATGFFSIDLKDYSWDPNADKIRFIIGGSNYSGQQGTVTFDYFSYSNDGGEWNNTANWAATPGGPGGASTPGAGDIAIFDGSAGSNGSCVFKADQIVSGIEITAGYSGNLDLEGYALVIGSAGLTVAGGGIAGNGARIDVDGNVDISGGAITNTGGQYFITGDINLTDGILDFADGDAVYLTGSGDQSVQTASATPIGALIIDKPAGDAVLESGIVIADALTLTEGRVRTQTHTLQIGTSDITPGQLTVGDGEVDGNLSRWVSSTDPRVLEFPLGSAGASTPVTLEVMGLPATPGTVSVKYEDGGTPAFSPVSFSDGPDELSERSTANWVMQAAGVSGGNYALSASNDDFAAIDDLSRLHLTRASSVVGTHVVATGTRDNPRLNRAGLTAIDLSNTWFAALEATALPLTWESVSAAAESGQVRVGWTTLDEQETAHFEIEYAVDGRSFVQIGRVSAAGNHPGTSAYQYHHRNPAEGLNHYRLRQVDLDGAASYSAIVTARVTEGAPPLITNLVNPIGDELRFTVREGDVTYRIVSLSGGAMLSGTLQAGDHVWDSTSWSAGMYQVFISGQGGLNQVLKVIKH